MRFDVKVVGLFRGEGARRYIFFDMYKNKVAKKTPAFTLRASLL